MLLEIADFSMDELMLTKVYIRVNDPDDHDLIDQIIDSLVLDMDDPAITVSNQYSKLDANQKALDLLDLIFYFVIGIMMFLCFFSLQSSMTANLYE